MQGYVRLVFRLEFIELRGELLVLGFGGVRGLASGSKRLGQPLPVRLGSLQGSLGLAQLSSKFLQRNLEIPVLLFVLVCVKTTFE